LQDKTVRTTVDIPDPVYRRLKARAASEGTTAKELILRGVEQVLQESRRKPHRRVKLPLVPSKKPGTLQLDNAKIYETISFP
jgi:hemolysin activation/secretion protein